MHVEQINRRGGWKEGNVWICFGKKDKCVFDIGGEMLMGQMLLH